MAAAHRMRVEMGRRAAGMPVRSGCFRSCRRLAGRLPGLRRIRIIRAISASCGWRMRRGGGGSFRLMVGWGFRRGICGSIGFRGRRLRWLTKGGRMVGWWRGLWGIRTGRAGVIYPAMATAGAGVWGATAAGGVGDGMAGGVSAVMVPLLSPRTMLRPESVTR